MERANQSERQAVGDQTLAELPHLACGLQMPLGPGAVLLRNSDSAQGNLDMRSQPRNILLLLFNAKE